MYQSTHVELRVKAQASQPFHNVNGQLVKQITQKI